ncbi:MAG: TrkH family potassium uptake protein [Boseongicola sp. SB0662_bin_57]|nr:TrkH family potassium uptake protein [Boseongicola sp. SB0662_bin_57]
MLLPAAHALAIDDHHTSRAFFYAALLSGLLFLMVALAIGGMRIRSLGRSHLISVVGCLVLLPVMLAVPVSEAVPGTAFVDAYVEMVSSITTTGLIILNPDSLPPSAHLWRAQVGWMGGFFIWVVAIAILAPLSLGGFEVTSGTEIGQQDQPPSLSVNPSTRLRRYALRLFPVYGGLTLALWLSLYLAGDSAFVALCHAMSTIATSGISPVGGMEGSEGGPLGEFIILMFLVFALSRLTFAREERPRGWRSLLVDPELRLGLVLVLVAVVLLLLWNWIASFEKGSGMSPSDGLRMLWGALFTVASFLTTTGFVAEEWNAARAWSGLGAPGVLLLGLALLGGGVATTAGGVKLLRVYALYQHGVREMEKLVQPSSIGGPGRQGRRFRRQGAYAAWVFCMLFALSCSVVMAGFSLIGGLGLEESLILTIAAFSTTGPLIEIAGSAPMELASLGNAALGLLCAAMVLGRLETLALIALLNPDFWR